MEALRLIGIGMVFGIANVIPGVSGGTIAVVFNVYDRLISVITVDVRKILSEWKFLLPLAAGIVIGLVLFSKLITLLFERYPVQTNWFFIGIILGSIPMIYGRVVGAGSPGKDRTDVVLAETGGTERRSSVRTRRLPSLSAVICCLAAFAVMAVMTFADVSEGGNVIQTTLTPALGVRLFIGLALGAVAMIIPGISGSFLMLVVGVYSTIIAAVADFNVPLLIVGAAGALTGLIGGAGLVRLLMERVPGQTYGAIFGLVLGSVLVIFPGFASAAGTAVSLLCAAAGFALSFFASRE